MQTAQFKRLLGCIGTLTSSQLEVLRTAVGSAHTQRSSLQVIETAKSRACGHCGSEHVVRNGTRVGLQRLLCRDCGKTSNAATGTPLSRLRHKEKFEAYAQCMGRGLTIQQAANEVGVCVDTAFRWRHRFLQEVIDHQPHAVSGLIEVDETYIRESQKGSRHVSRKPRKRGGKAKGRGRSLKDWVPILVGRARGQAFTTDKVLPRMNGNEIAEALKDVVQPGETILCTDGHSAFLHLQRTLGVATKSFVASYHGPVLDKVYHVQSVNNYHERLKSWIQRKLRGVSTKYLPSYLAWMRLTTWNKTGVTPREIVISALGRQIINL